MVLEARPPDRARIQRTDRWRAVDGQLTRMTETATPKIRSQFRREKRRLLDAIGEGADAEEAGELVDVQEWERVLSAIWIGFGKILFRQTFAEIEALKVDTPDLEEFPELVAAIGGFVALRATALVENTKRRLLFIERRLITSGAAASEATLLTEADGLYTKWEAGRSASVARHNVGAATALAQNAAAGQIPVRLTHEWVSMADGRVRASHRDADGQIKREEEPFLVGGEILEFPRDPAGSPAETANCRCQQVFAPDTASEFGENPDLFGTGF